MADNRQAMNEVAFTIFTATYNRAHTLQRVYDSCMAQTFRDFEWLIIDDGSTDETAALVANWQAQADFPIRYYYQENSGKHIAHNRAVLLSNGFLFAHLDSDDAFVANALERIHERWEQIPSDRRDLYAGVWARSNDQFGNPVGDDIRPDPLDSNLLEMIYVHRFSGEMWGFMRTDILRGYLFPPVENTSHIPEGVVWNRIARRYLTRFINERLRVYYTNEGEDTLSGTGQMTWARLRRMAPGLAYWHADTLNTQMDYFRIDPGRFVRHALQFVRFSWIIGNGPRSQWNMLDSVSARLLYLIASVPGSLLYLRDRVVLPRQP